TVVHRVRMMCIGRGRRQRGCCETREHRYGGEFIESHRLPLHVDRLAETAQLKPRSSSCVGRSMSCSKFSSQILAHGRSNMSGTLNGITWPGATCVAKPSIG